MKLRHYIFCVVVIIVGVFCFINMYEMFSVSSGEYGSAINIVTKNEYNEVSTFDFGSLSFDTNDNVKFTNISTFVPTEFNGKENEYILLFNDNLVTNLVVTSGSISGDFIRNFYDTNGEIITTSNLKILVEFLETEIRTTLNITNENDSVSYLSTYANINGAVLKVVKRGNINE